MPGPTAAAPGPVRRATARSTMPAASPRQPQWTIATRFAVGRGRPGSSRRRARAGPGPGSEVTCPSTRSQLGARAGVAGIRRRRVPLGQLRAVHLPAHGHPFAAGARAGRQAAPVLRHVGRVVLGEHPEIERPVGPLAHAAVAVGEEHPRAAGAATPSSILPRQRQRAPELVLATGHEAVQLSVERPLECTAHRRALGHAGSQEVVAGYLETHARQLGHATAGSARVGRRTPAPAPASRGARDQARRGARRRCARARAASTPVAAPSAPPT